jgi:hypothetical protein
MVSAQRDPVVLRLTFRHSDVFDASDGMARYVMRLSTALGDLQIAAYYASRERQPPGERVYFIRLTASHLREALHVIDPQPDGPIPQLEEFLRALPRGVRPTRAEIRKSHRRVLALLEEPMAAGRPEIEHRPGRMRRPTLRDDLKMLRNGFFHYGHLQSGDDAIARAMTRLHADQGRYVVRERTRRAEYADDVSAVVAHPFPAQYAREMNKRIVRFLGPVSTFIHQIEEAWLDAHAAAVTAREPGAPPEPLTKRLP